MRIPELRQRLLAVSQVIYDRWRSFDEQGAKVLADPYTTVVPLPLPNEWSEEPKLNKLKESGALTENTVFVRNPFADDTYDAIGEAMSQFGIAKYEAIARLCSVLGVKALTAEEAREFDGTKQRTWTAKGSNLIVSGGGEHGTTTGERITQAITAKWEYKDKGMDADAADRILTQYRLNSDRMISGMVELRAQSALTRKTWKVILTNEASSATQFAANLRVLLPDNPLSDLKGRLESESTHSERYRLEVDLDVEFWPLRRKR